MSLRARFSAGFTTNTASWRTAGDGDLSTCGLLADYLRTTGLLRALPEGQHREEAHPFAVPTGADDQRVDAEHGRELADKNSLSLRRRAPGSPRYLNLVRFRLK